MIGIVLIAVVSLSVGGTFASCPFSGTEFNDAYVRVQMLDTARDNLVDRGFTVKAGEPAHTFFGTGSMIPEMIALTNNSNIALLAELIHRDLCADKAKKIDPIDLQQMANGENVCPATNIVCNANSKYRTIDGTCNNLESPRMGGANTAYGRLAQAAYDDNVYAIRKSVSNTPLLSPRKIANRALQHSTFNPYPSQMANIASLAYGQVIAHDSGWRMQHQSAKPMKGFSCCSKDYSHVLSGNTHIFGCAAMEVAKDDPVLRAKKVGCVNYVRSQTVLANDCKMQGAQQINLSPHLLDLSEMYGLDAATQKATRSFTGGKLRSENNILPQRSPCTNTEKGCYFSAADPRSTAFPTLASQEALLLRLHNVVADKLSVVNSKWNDEQIYNEARRITIALHQHIVYDHWLPIYLGHDNTVRRQLSCTNKSFCGRYNPEIDHSTTNEFAHGALRTFHENLPYKLNGYEKNNHISKQWTFGELLGNVKFLEQNMTIFTRGLMNDAISLDRYHEYFRNYLFTDDSEIGMGIDLLAHDIQKGRDHGLQSYTYYLNKCYPAIRINTDNDLLGLFSAKSIAALKEVYEHLDDVDLIVGLLLEEKRSKYTGLVASCILEEQFHRFKYGDRYFFSFAHGPNPFTQSQLDEIYKFSFGKLMCETTDIDSVLDNSFLVPSITNRLKKCGHDLLAPLDLTAWAV